MDYTSANNHHQSNQNDNLATKRQGSTNSGKTGGKSQYYNGAIMMTTMPINESQMAELDRLGAHFKFLDLTQRLNKVIQESRQERRSQELLLYQAHFSKNDPTEVEQQSPTILRRDFIRKEQPSVAQQNAGGTSGGTNESGASQSQRNNRRVEKRVLSSLPNQQQSTSGATNDNRIREPHASIERQTEMVAAGSALMAKGKPLTLATGNDLNHQLYASQQGVTNQKQQNRANPIPLTDQQLSQLQQFPLVQFDNQGSKAGGGSRNPKMGLQLDVIEKSRTQGIQQSNTTKNPNAQLISSSLPNQGSIQQDNNRNNNNIRQKQNLSTLQSQAMHTIHNNNIGQRQQNLMKTQQLGLTMTRSKDGMMTGSSVINETENAQRQMVDSRQKIEQNNKILRQRHSSLDEEMMSSKYQQLRPVPNGIKQQSLVSNRGKMQQSTISKQIEAFTNTSQNFQSAQKASNQQQNNGRHSPFRVQLGKIRAASQLDSYQSPVVPLHSMGQHQMQPGLNTNASLPTGMVAVGPGANNGSQRKMNYQNPSGVQQIIRTEGDVGAASLTSKRLPYYTKNKPHHLPKMNYGPQGQ